VTENNQSDDYRAYLPTPEQIQAHCLAIQSTWSESTRAARAGWQSDAEVIQCMTATRKQKNGMYQALGLTNHPPILEKNPESVEARKHRVRREKTK
jgi:hypothetical protein